MPRVRRLDSGRKRRPHPTGGGAFDPLTQWTRGTSAARQESDQGLSDAAFRAALAREARPTSNRCCEDSLAEGQGLSRPSPSWGAGQPLARLPPSGTRCQWFPRRKTCYRFPQSWIQDTTTACRKSLPGFCSGTLLLFGPRTRKGLPATRTRRSRLRRCHLQEVPHPDIPAPQAWPRDRHVPP